MGMQVGLTETQLRENFSTLEKLIGKVQADAAISVLDQTENKK
jgi:hypothetical protein